MSRFTPTSPKKNSFVPTAEQRKDYVAFAQGALDVKLNPKEGANLDQKPGVYLLHKMDLDSHVSTWSHTPVYTQLNGSTSIRKEGYLLGFLTQEIGNSSYFLPGATDRGAIGELNKIQTLNHVMRNKIDLEQTPRLLAEQTKVIKDLAPIKDQLPEWVIGFGVDAFYSEVVRTPQTVVKKLLETPEFEKFAKVSPPTSKTYQYIVGGMGTLTGLERRQQLANLGKVIELNPKAWAEAKDKLNVTADWRTDRVLNDVEDRGLDR